MSDIMKTCEMLSLDPSAFRKALQKAVAHLAADEAFRQCLAEERQRRYPVESSTDEDGKQK